MNQKILFTDLDDTLLNSDKQICAENRDAITRMLQQGHKIVLTSGRALASVRNQAEHLGLTFDGCYLIAYNGAQIYDMYREKTLFRKRLPAEILPEIFQYVSEIHEVNQLVHIHGYNDQAVIADHMDQTLVTYSHDMEMEYRIMPDLMEYMKKDIPSKLLMIAYYDHDILEEMKNTLVPRYKDILEISFSSPYHLDIVPKGITKGNAILQLAKLLNIPFENTVAAGDAMNDYTMIQAAHIGCVMENGEDTLKEVADYVTVKNQNTGGVAEVIEKFILHSL